MFSWVFNHLILSLKKKIISSYFYFQVSHKTIFIISIHFIYAFTSLFIIISWIMMIFIHSLLYVLDLFSTQHYPLQNGGDIYTTKIDISDMILWCSRHFCDITNVQGRSQGVSAGARASYGFFQCNVNFWKNHWFFLKLS